MTAPLIPAVWFPFILNLLLQVFDGLLSYHVLSEGVPEANPFVSRAISEWGCGLGFILFENVCLCFAFLDLCPEEQTTIPNDQSFTVTAAVYSYVSIASLIILLLHFPGEIRSKKISPVAYTWNYPDFEADWDRKSSRYGDPYRVRGLELRGIAGVDPRSPFLGQQRFEPDSNAHCCSVFWRWVPSGSSASGRHFPGVAVGYSRPVLW